MVADNTLYYKDMATPVGCIRLVASDAGLVAILWEGEDYGRTKLNEPCYEATHPVLVRTEQQLLEYFAEQRTGFDIALDLRGSDFQLKIWKALLAIPYGMTRSYGDLARDSGDLKAVRAVGGALNRNPVSIIVPCHRVIGSSGTLTGFAGGLHNKSILLQLERKRLAPGLFED